MARQFEVFRLPDGGRVVVMQSDLLDETPTRVVFPMLPVSRAPAVGSRLNPVVTVNGKQLVVMPQIVATLAVRDLGEREGSVEEARDALIAAFDFLITGF